MMNNGAVLGIECTADGALLVVATAAEGVIDQRRTFEPPTLTSLQADLRILAERTRDPLVAIGVAGELAWPAHIQVARDVELPVFQTMAGTCLALATCDGDGLVLDLSGPLVAGARLDDRPTHLDVAHLPLWPLGPRCACGQRGCVQTTLEAQALQRRARQLHIRLQQGFSVQATLTALSRRGDPLALALLDDIAADVARVLQMLLATTPASTAVVLWPDARPDDPLQVKIQRRIKQLQVNLATPHPQAIALGAARWAMQRVQQNLPVG